MRFAIAHVTELSFSVVTIQSSATQRGERFPAIERQDGGKMKTLNLKKIALLCASMLSLLLLGTTFLLGTQILTTTQGKIGVVSINSPFFVRSYGGKCLDFGSGPQVSGSPVFIYSCNGTAAQQVIVQEINDRHEVVLHAGNKVIGVNENRVITLTTQVILASTLAPGATVVAETRLELQDADPILGYSASQIFA